MQGDHDPGTTIVSSALEKSHIVRAVRCVIRYAKAMNNSASSVWLHVFDATSVPVLGTKPDRIPIPVAANSVNGEHWGDRGTRFASGCVVALSSTMATYTPIAGNDGLFEVEVAG